MIRGSRVSTSLDHSHRKDKMRSMHKASKLLCVMMCTILRMSDSGHTIIMCFYSKGQHRKRFRVTHVVQVPVFALRMEHFVLLQTVTHAVTVSSTAPVYLSLWLVIQQPYKHDLWQIRWFSLYSLRRWMSQLVSKL